MSMTPQQLQATSLKNVRVVRVEPKVKSAETCELSLRGVSAKAKTAKTADPTCYNLCTVNETGLFENVETNMKERSARDLVMGARVTWDHDDNKAGTVIEKGPQRLAVKWDDPSEGETSYLFYTEMANIGLAPFRGDLSRSEVGI